MVGILYTQEVQDQTKWLVFRMIHGFRIPDPIIGQSLVDLDFLGIYFMIDICIYIYNCYCIYVFPFWEFAYFQGLNAMSVSFDDECQRTLNGVNVNGLSGCQLQGLQRSNCLA